MGKPGCVDTVKRKNVLGTWEATAPQTQLIVFMRKQSLVVVTCSSFSIKSQNSRDLGKITCLIFQIR